MTIETTDDRLDKILQICIRTWLNVGIYVIPQAKEEIMKIIQEEREDYFDRGYKKGTGRESR